MTVKTLVDPKVFVPLPLAEVEVINHDTRRFRFRLPSSNHVLGVPIGQHLKLSAEINGEVKSHSYTPVSSDDDVGYVDLVIKIYFKNVHPKFPEGGKLTQYIESMKIGDTIDFRGPMGRLKYLGLGNFSMKFTRKDDEEPITVHVKKVSMIAGGSGIAPMLQLIRNITQNAEDETKLSLLFANKSEEDIMLRNELEEVAKDHANRFKLWYTVDNAPEGWKYSTGFVNDEMISSHLYEPAPDTLVLMCGPHPMIDLACIPALDKLGYDPKLRFKY